MGCMGDFIAQIRAAAAQDLYYVALMATLNLVDICGALQAENGQASGPKFKKWLRANVPTHAMNAELIYGLRCSLLHQGRALPKGSHFPMAFMGPGNLQLHNLVTEADGDEVGWLSIEMFVEEVTAGAEGWLRDYGSTPTVERNLERFARLRPEGLPPHVEGQAVIT